MDKMVKLTRYIFPLLVSLLWILGPSSFAVEPMGKIKLQLEQIATGDLIEISNFSTITLIHYRRIPVPVEKQTKRWEGDRSGQFKHIETKRETIDLSTVIDGIIYLKPGFYMLKLNTVSGRPPSGFYGQSDIYEVMSGDEHLTVTVTLAPAI